MYIFKKTCYAYILNIFKYNINVMNINIYMHMFVYLSIHNKYTQHTHMYYVKKLFLFWMRLIVINHLTALIYIYIINQFLLLKLFMSGLNEGFNDSLMNVCFIYERISRF